MRTTASAASPSVHADKAKRPWWKRKRWLAVAVLWIAIGYPIGFGPIVYGYYSGWIPTPVFRLAEIPVTPIFSGDNHFADVCLEYVVWRSKLALDPAG